MQNNPDADFEFLAVSSGRSSNFAGNEREKCITLYFSRFFYVFG